MQASMTKNRYRGKVGIQVRRRDASKVNADAECDCKPKRGELLQPGDQKGLRSEVAIAIHMGAAGR